MGGWVKTFTPKKLFFLPNHHYAMEGKLATSLPFCILPLRAGVKGFLRGFRGRKAQVSPL
ncbi:hypothetical protein BKH46_09170 [Helicobacter sp. 12S02634-8]|nr:hypothetical protein BKH46_09170 [Helicobacter sp. 12S02634-8]